MSDKYRNLSQQEIDILENNGCRPEDWSRILIGGRFDPQGIRNVRFAGDIKLGSPSGSENSPIIENAVIENCSIGGGVTIRNIGDRIANYDIGAGANIVDCGSIETTGKTRFGNGVPVRTINEGGGREVILHDALTAQTAYLSAMYRHIPHFITAFEKIVERYCRSTESERGLIGENATVRGCGRIENVRIGSHATLEGATLLRNGTLNSTAADPSHIGADVKLYDFITAPGSRIDNGSILERCFIGEAVVIDRGFTATDSLFFANSDCAAGEACSVFAGPYTVSHHRSSLLIAGYFLFFNAGSGSNQSNHLFKKGPLHQGIHERGCKFASNAYIMLPAREGAFSVVIGRHTDHHDTSELPYSYLTEEGGKTFLMPGFNLRTYGTLRDHEKWPYRDSRKETCRDILNFEEFNPYIGNKILAAVRLLEKFTAKDTQEHIHNRTRIKHSILGKSLKLYKLALNAAIAHILSNNPTGNSNKISEIPQWVDMAGMFAPKKEVDGLVDKIACGGIDDLDAVIDSLRSLNSDYPSNAQSWALSVARDLHGELSEDLLEKIIEQGKEAREELLRMRHEDSGKDDGAAMMVGYGIDDREMASLDFEAVRK